MNNHVPPITIRPSAMKMLADATIVFEADKLTIKTMHAGTAVAIAELAKCLDEQDWPNYKLTGSNDGWCFLVVHFKPKHTLKLELPGLP